MYKDLSKTVYLRKLYMNTSHKNQMHTQYNRCQMDSRRHKKQKEIQLFFKVDMYISYNPHLLLKIQGIAKFL